MARVPTPFTVLIAALVCACGPATPAPGSVASATPQAAETPEPPAATPAGERDEITIGTRQSFASTVLGEERTYLVHTPTGYERGTDVYPVVYLLDGPAHFHHTTGLLEYLARLGRAPQMIVVGVANTDRTRDLTPTRVGRFATSGGADAFLTFIETELIPRIEQNYRTAPYRILIGHSFGGLLAVHALNTKPELFNALVSISPSLWWSDGLMLRNTTASLAANPGLDRFLYLTVGAEADNMMTSNRAYAAMLRERAPASLRWHYEEMEREDHGSIPHRATYRALELLFADWRPKGDIATLAALDAHYRQMSSRFGYEIKPSELRLNLFGYGLLGRGQVDAAIEVFRRNVELYPKSANVYDSLGEALEAKGEREEALRSYETAVRVANETDDPQRALFAERLEQARRRAEAANQ